MFRKTGAACVAAGLQNTHSGNLSVREDLPGGPEMYITRSGAMLGHIERDDICAPGLDEPRPEVKGASSESEVHRGALKYSRAVIHAHPLCASVISADRGKIRPADLWGLSILGEIPVLEFDPWVGNPGVREKIPEVLRNHPVMMTARHGSFARGDNLAEALYHTAILECSSKVIYESMLLGVDLEKARRAAGESEIIENFGEFLLNDEMTKNNGTEHSPKIEYALRDVFYLGLSPFGTGSVSIRDGREMLFVPAASRPKGFEGPVRREPVEASEDDGWEISLHKAAYSAGQVGAAVFTMSPEALAQAWLEAQNETWLIKPIDIEGQYHYPSIPVMRADDDVTQIAGSAVRHKMVVLAGAGVLATGIDLAAAMHQVSSIKNICFYRTALDCLSALGKGPRAVEFEK